MYPFVIKGLQKRCLFYQNGTNLCIHVQKGDGLLDREMEPPHLKLLCSKNVQITCIVMWKKVIIKNQTSTKGL